VCVHMCVRMCACTPVCVPCCPTDKGVHDAVLEQPFLRRENVLLLLFPVC